jgi:hypothetical protein
VTSHLVEADNPVAGTVVIISASLVTVNFGCETPQMTTDVVPMKPLPVILSDAPTLAVVGSTAVILGMYENWSAESVALFPPSGIPATHQHSHRDKHTSRNASDNNVENPVRICWCIWWVVGRATALRIVGKGIIVGCRASSHRIGYHDITHL